MLFYVQCGAATAVQLHHWCLSCPYWTHIMLHGEDSTVSYMVWLRQGKDEQQGRSWVQLQQQSCTEYRIVVQSLRMHHSIPNSMYSWHSHWYFQTLHLKNIHFPSLSTSHTPCILLRIHRRLNNYSFTWTLLCIYPQSSVSMETFSLPSEHSSYYCIITFMIMHMKCYIIFTYESYLDVSYTICKSI